VEQPLANLLSYLSPSQDYQPLPPSDMARTHADISESQSVLGYTSTVSVEVGVREFVRWFKEYKSLRERNEEEQRNRPLE
jgi:nucleoside-diphosphate-sugar epimerase